MLMVYNFNSWQRSPVAPLPLGPKNLEFFVSFLVFEEVPISNSFTRPGQMSHLLKD